MKKLWRVMILGGALALQWPAQAQSPPAPRHQLQLPAASANNAVEDAGGSVQFIGTATVLIRFRGMTILTDPNFLHKGEHVHLGYGLKSERHAGPPRTAGGGAAVAAGDGRVTSGARRAALVDLVLRLRPMKQNHRRAAPP